MMNRSVKYSFQIFLALVCYSAVVPLYAQTIMSGNIETHVDSLISALPAGSGADTNKYQVPTALQLAAWGNTITKITEGNYTAAQESASTIGYRLVKFTHTAASPSVVYYILEKNAGGTNYWGVFAYNPAPLRGKLFIQSPHPLYDSNTGQQGIMIFRNTGARAFYVSGTHRCNNTTATTCSGTTDVCGGDYRVSDQAHVVNGPLHQATVTLSGIIAQMVVIQNHGFGKDVGDPDVIMGNGRATAPTGTDWLVNVRDELAAIDNILTFKVAHVDVEWTSLTGTTNTQGRFINGSVNPCNSAPSSANGRFLHIEQALTGLRNNSTNRKKLSDAIAAAFDADVLSLTSPNGGENLVAGNSHDITWSSAGLITNVKLEYTINNGTTWNTITASTANDGSYSWTVPNTGTWRAKIRVTDTENSSVGDTSSSVFKIAYTVFPTTGSTAYVDPAAAFGPRMLSGVYDFHRGVDYPNILNTPIRPARPGVIVRREDTTVTAISGLSRNGNWILVRIDSSGGQPRHTAYLHLNAFNTSLQVGDTVSTQDTIGFMGKSGVGINTIHCHFEFYKNLSGTSIDKDKAKNPFEILPYVNSNAYSVSFGTSNDSSSVIIASAETELDVDGVTVYGSSAVRTVGFNARTGIDPADNDNPRYNGLLIDPWTFTIDSSTQRLRFWVKQSESGNIDSVAVTDVNGYSVTVTNSSSGTRYAVASGNWDGAIWAASQGGAADSASVPAAENNIVINTGVTVTVNTASAECRSVSFGSTTSKFSLSAASALNVYGNFTLYSTTHNAFSAWAAGAKLRFKGSAHQIISGWDNASSATINTTLMEVEVDKSSDTVRTPGTDMKLSLGTSLTVINGLFMLDSTDDVNGKNLAGSSSSKPAITVQSGGQFIQRGGAHHLRAGTSGTNPVGKVVVYGTAQFASSSSLGVSVDSVTVESGGTVILNSFSNSQPNNASFNRIDVKSGAALINNSTVNFWNASTTVNLSAGGVYRIGASTTVMPPIFNNSGTVQYARASGDGSQTIIDMNYPSLSIASAGVKTWNLAAGRTITDTLEMSNGTLTLSSASRTLSVQGVLKMVNDTIFTGTNTVSLGTSTSIRGTLQYSNGVIVGNFSRWFTNAATDSTLFPVGVSSKVRPAALSFTSAPSTGGTVTAFFSAATPGSSGLPLNDAGTQIINTSNDGYWSLTAGNGLSGGIYSLALSAHGVSGISDRTSLRILKRPTGNPWTLDGAHAVGVGTNSSPTVRRTGLNGFSEFAIGAAEDNPLAVEMDRIEASTDRFSVTLSWMTTTEQNNYGFEVERGSDAGKNAAWIPVGFVRGNGTTNVPMHYQFKDKVDKGGKYLYRIKQIDTGGTWKIVQYITVDVGTMPRQLMLFQNYPNPFNPSTSIDFTTPKDGAAVVRVFNTIGQQVAELFHGHANGGWLYQTRFNAGTLPSGVYVVRLDASGSSMMREILFLK